MARLLGQAYDGPLVVLALGPSTDRTDALAAELAAWTPARGSCPTRPAAPRRG